MKNNDFFTVDMSDTTIRKLIRYGLKHFLVQAYKADESEQAKEKHTLIQILKDSPIAIETETANEQHYEVPAEFFQYCLGDSLRYSCCYWSEGVTHLDQAEQAMLEKVVTAADIKSGQTILDLGCGWGSTALYIAEHFPDCQVYALSNSHSQKSFIDTRALQKGLNNLQVYTGNVVDYEFESAQFDRIISVEMFEHMRNYQALLAKISRWMKDDALLFVHIFSHKTLPYLFDENNVVSSSFFSGGIMPSDDLLLHFQGDVVLQKQWQLSGQHYQKTAEAWLTNMYQHKTEIMSLFRQHYGEQAEDIFHQWRCFWIICAEVWGFENGDEWIVSHYRFAKNSHKG